MYLLVPYLCTQLALSSEAHGEVERGPDSKADGGCSVLTLNNRVRHFYVVFEWVSIEVLALVIGIFHNT